MSAQHQFNFEAYIFTHNAWQPCKAITNILQMACSSLDYLALSGISYIIPDIKNSYRCETFKNAELNVKSKEVCF